ncbi:hypothetical protein HC931_20710 [Candidatus Gracilibacteria bacterium]|nr:hypothetical protein [Candidatus Gracilibacteria bacterium]NJM89515.1 hypothetical protein [Hydrococcus sp. RU_2_2]NJP20764.1 hypothetical protein [Hydrococcus sp. CRU_1_1]
MSDYHLCVLDLLTDRIQFVVLTDNLSRIAIHPQKQTIRPTANLPALQLN